MSMTSPALHTLADLLERLGGVPLDRIRFRPFGTATLQDVLEVQQREGRLCEVVEGVLLEKTVGCNESSLAVFLSGLLNAFVISRNLGIVTGPDGTVELRADLVRIPDVAFTSWDRLPGRRRPAAPVPNVIPNLVVEILSRANTAGEMALKRDDYFSVGVQLLWEIDPELRRIVAYTSPTVSVVYGTADLLHADAVLPDFVLCVRELFAELDRHG